MSPLKVFVVLTALRKWILTGMMLLCIVPVSACGKKPPNVDAPLGAEKTGFPRVYPDPDANK